MLSVARQAMDSEAVVAMAVGHPFTELMLWVQILTLLDGVSPSTGVIPPRNWPHRAPQSQPRWCLLGLPLPVNDHPESLPRWQALCWRIRRRAAAAQPPALRAR